MQQPGTTIQLHALGPQDVQIGTAAEAGYVFPQHHTIDIPLPFFGSFSEVPVTFASGQTARARIPATGDLFVGAALELHLPAVVSGNWVPKVSLAMFRRTKLVIDGQVVVDHERLWADIADAFEDKTLVPQTSLPGHTPHVLWLPLRLGVGGAHNPLPLKELQHSVVEVVFETEDFRALVSSPPAEIQAKVVCHYVHLDDIQRGLQPAKIPYTMVQDSDASTSQSVNLARITGPPVGALAWVTYSSVNNPFFEYLPPETLRDRITFGSADAIPEMPRKYFASPLTQQNLKAGSSKIAYRSFGVDADPRDGELPNVLDFARAKAPVLRSAGGAGGAGGAVTKVFGVCQNYLVLGNGSARVGVL